MEETEECVVSGSPSVRNIFNGSAVPFRSRRCSYGCSSWLVGCLCLVLFLNEYDDSPCDACGMVWWERLGELSSYVSAYTKFEHEKLTSCL